MPESKVRKAAADKRKQNERAQLSDARDDQKRTVAAPGSRQWVPPAFISLGLFGVLWLVVYYITASVGVTIPLMTDLGGWNVMIGMGGMAGAFALATLWK